MKHTLTQLAFGLCANALVVRNAPQCVQLKASGGASGVLGQLDDGQNRIGGSHPTGCYCFSNGGFTDSKGRGCILTPPTTQFQCDVGATPTYGFTLNSDGSVTYNSNDKFYACPVNDYGEFNVYTMPISGQTKCVEIKLNTAGSCGASSTPLPPPKPATPAPVQAPKTCPADLNGAYQFPHLIIPVDSQSPTTPHGTSYFGHLSKTTCTIFNFDIPASFASNTCTLLFLFPLQKDLQTSSFTVSGTGHVRFTQLTSPATQATTFANQPAAKHELGTWALEPGHSYTIANGACAAGSTVAYELCSDGDYALEYFQDFNPSPIGLFIRQC